MKKIACLLLIISFCFIKKLDAQEPGKQYQTALKLNLTAATDIISFPTIRMALEHAVAPGISLSGELGYQFYSMNGSDAGSGFAKEKGIKAGLELRRYAGGSHNGALYPPLAGFYMGANVLYTQNQRNFIAYYYKENDPTEYTDRYYARKTTTGSTLFSSISDLLV